MVRALTTVAAAGLIAAAAAPAHADTLRLVYATDWLAQAEHGGMYQAVAMGLYDKYGLDVDIRMGGPQVDNQQLVAARAVDIATGTNGFFALNLANNDADVLAVMSMFQKDPQILMTHPRDDINSIADMAGQPVLLAGSSVSTFWVWLKATYGFDDAQVRPYTFNMAPWLADDSLIQQGYLSSEPFLVREAGVEPEVYLLADEGYPTYSSMALVPGEMVRDNPEAVQGFVNATIEGWYHYLYGDRTAADALIMAANPDMTPDKIAFGVESLKSFGILDSGDALDQGIGAMTDARWREFADIAIGAGLYPQDLDLSKAYTTQFVNAGHGLDIKASLTQ